MPNTYFQFKQFRVNQDRCALKVCTDACIQGAVTAKWLRNRLNSHDVKPAPRLLDIGTGTGLLSLMMAQAIPEGYVEGVEFDVDTALQAAENFCQSPWSDRLKSLAIDVRTFEPTSMYDYIISNPPFYEEDLKSTHPGKARAKHTISLSFDELLMSIDRLLHECGFFSIMLPASTFKRWRAMAKRNDFYPCYILEVGQSPAHNYFRTIGIFCRGEIAAPQKDRLFIKDIFGKYTLEMKDLLEDYYLYFPGN